MDYRAGPGSGSSQMWIPLECAFSLIVHPLKGPGPLLSVRPCCTPASVLRPSSFPTACTGTATAGTRASLVGGRTLLQPGGGDWGAGGLSPSPLFFPGARHWGAEGGNSGKLTRGERIWFCSAGSPNPWPFLGMPLTSPAPLMERTALAWARPAPQRLPNDSLTGQSGSPGFQPASSCPGSCNSLPSGGIGSSLSHFRPSLTEPLEIFLRHKSQPRLWL